MHPKLLVLELSLLDRPHLISDQYINYENGLPSNASHDPISWHSYAAAMNGRFISAPHSDLKEHIEWADIILATWNYSPLLAKNVITQIKKLGKPVILAFHENGDMFQKNAKNLQWLIDFRECANMCDAIMIYPHHEIFGKIYEGMGIKAQQVYIPQPYDIEGVRKYIVPELRRGIFIGPQLKDDEIEHRNFILNVLLAAYHIKEHKHIYPSITIINSSPAHTATVGGFLNRLCPGIMFNIYNKLSYEEYLECLAQHQYYINADTSFTQGQVDLDAMALGLTPLVWDMGFGTDYGSLYRQNFSQTAGSNAPLSFVEKYCSFEVCKQQLTQLYYQLKGK